MLHDTPACHTKDFGHLRCLAKAILSFDAQKLHVDHVKWETLCMVEDLGDGKGRAFRLEVEDAERLCGSQ